MSLYVATDWAQGKYKQGNASFAAIAPFTPLCWVGSAYIARTIGARKHKAYPETLFDKWAQVPMRIFAAGADGYDGEDPKACDTFISAIPDAKQKSLSSVQLYPDAMHGWDYGKDFTFPASGGCKGSGCNVTIKSNADVTEKGKADLLNFLREALKL